MGVLRYRPYLATWLNSILRSVCRESFAVRFDRTSRLASVRCGYSQIAPHSREVDRGSASSPKYGPCASPCWRLSFRPCADAYASRIDSGLSWKCRDVFSWINNRNRSAEFERIANSRPSSGTQFLVRSFGNRHHFVSLVHDVMITV